MKRFYYDLKLKLGYLIQGIKTRNDIHLMDIVVYKEKEYFVNNATKYCGQCMTPIYDLIENVPYEENSKRELVSASAYYVKKVKNWSNFKRGIFAAYDFQMLYWHDMNLRELME